MFVKDKELWGHLDGSSKAPIDPKKIDYWESKNAYIIFWLQSYIKPYMMNNFLSFITSMEMWIYL